LRGRRSGQANAFGNHPADVLDFEDFLSFGEMLGAESDERMRFDFADGVRSRLLSARRRVAVFARAVIRQWPASSKSLDHLAPISMLNVGSRLSLHGFGSSGSLFQ
jgi:hypothetical protein